MLSYRLAPLETSEQIIASLNIYATGTHALPRKPSRWVGCWPRTPPWR
jgi:hypothetical protein